MIPFAFLPVLDAVAITTYPSFYFSSPDRMPSDYYSQLIRHTSLRVIVAESGWPSGGDPSLHGSIENQQRFLIRFTELTRGVTLDLWIWWFFHDWAGEGYPEAFKTMGLRTSEGSPKPAWTAWESIHNLPRRVKGVSIKRWLPGRHR